MKNVRWFRPVMVCGLVLLVVGGTMALAIKRTDRQEPEPKPTKSAVWKSIKKPIDLLGPSISLNLLDLPDNAQWIVGVTPTKDGQKQEASVGLVHWVNIDESQTRKIERIDTIQDYPQGLIDVATDAVNIRGSEALVAADKTLIIYLTIHAGTQVNLNQNGTGLGTSLISSERGFCVKNGVPIDFPVSGPSALLTYLQTDRIMRITGGDPKEVQIHAKN